MLKDTWLFRLHVLAALVTPTMVVGLLLAFVVATQVPTGATSFTGPARLTEGWSGLPRTMSLEYRPAPQELKAIPVVETVVTAPNAETEAVVHAGQWIDILTQIILAILGVVVTVVAGYMPAVVRPFFLNKRTTQLYTNAVYQMMAKARKAGDIAPDGTLHVDVGSKWLKDVLEYVDANADTELKKWLGGPDQIVAKAKAFTEMILASNATQYNPPKVTVTPIATPTSNIKQPKA